MLGAVITPFVVAKRDGGKIKDKDNTSTRRSTTVYAQNIRSMRCEYGDTEKVEWMGMFFPTVMSL